MAFTSRAEHFGARHPQSLIDFFDHILLLDRRPETRPARSRVKLLRGTKERQLARRAFKSALLVNVVHRTRVGVFSSLLPQDIILLGRELTFPLCVRLD